MVNLIGLRTKAIGILLVSGLLSLCIGGAYYLVTNRLDRPALVFLILGLGLLAFYVIEDYQTVASALTGRSARYGGNTIAMVLIFLAIIGVLNLLASRYSYRFDLTAAREFSLSPQTVKVLQSLEEPVRVKAFFRDEDYGRTQVQDLLREYQRETDKVRYDFVDWEARPAEAVSYRLQSFPAIVIESASRRQELAGFTEQDLTSGIFKVSQGAAKKVYFTTGHGEPDIAGRADADLGEASQALEDSNYSVETINLAATSAVSEDVAAIIVNAPKTPLLTQEKEVLKAYLDRGGKVMLLIAPKRTADLSDLIQPYGLQVADGFAIDAGQALPRQPYVPVVTSYPDFSPVTRDIDSTEQAVLVPMASQITSQQAPGATVTRLLETTPESWLATDENDISYHDGDVRGPLTIAMAATADAKTAAETAGGMSAGSDSTFSNSPPKTRLVVFGSADLVTNAAIGALANRQLFVNAVNWLTEEEDLISIRPQPPVDRTLILTGIEANLIVYSSVLFLPLAVAAAGAWVWWRRR